MATGKTPCLVLKPEHLITLGGKTTEGPVWDERTKRLYFIDILGKEWESDKWWNAKGRVYCYNPETKVIEQEMIFNENVGTAVPTETPHIWIVAKNNDMVAVDMLAGKELGVVSTTPKGEMEGFRSNDGKATPSGDIIQGFIYMDTRYCTEKRGRVYLMEPNGSNNGQLARMKDIGFGPTVKISNGLDWDMSRGVLYHIDSLAYTVDAYKCDERGVPLVVKDPDTGKDAFLRKELMQIPHENGIPDGMCLDCNGDLWVAHFGGYMVACYDKDTGEMKAKVQLPVRFVTSCNFGGENLETLYITTACHMEDPKNIPEGAGDVYQIKIPGIKGLCQPFLYKGKYE